MSLTEASRTACCCRQGVCSTRWCATSACCTSAALSSSSREPHNPCRSLSGLSCPLREPDDLLLASALLCCPKESRRALPESGLCCPLTIFERFQAVCFRSLGGCVFQRLAVRAVVSKDGQAIIVWLQGGVSGAAAGWPPRLHRACSTATITRSIYSLVLAVL